MALTLHSSAQERELCPFDLAPVTSAALQMLFGDTIAIALMQVRTTCDPTAWRVCGPLAVLMKQATDTAFEILRVTCWL